MAEPRRPGRLPRRLLLARVRARREPAHLLRRARRSRRRPPQGRLGARRPARRRRPLLPPRLLPPAARRDGPAGRALPADRHRAGCRSSSCPWRRWSSSPTTSGSLVPVRLGVWRARVGRVSLYLLDTKVEGNPEWADVTDTLYGGDRENRLRQELVLGVGGVRVLRRLGLEPTVFHLNEGHSAFLQLERMRELVEEQGLDAGRGARAAARVDRLHDAHAGAGRERGVRPRARAPQRSERSSSAAASRGTTSLALGKVEPDETRFGLTPFALRTAAVRERRLGAPRRGLARDVARRSGPSGASTRCRSRRSRTASTGRTVDLGRARGPARRHGAATSSARASFRTRMLWQAHRGAKERLLDVRRADARRRASSTRTRSRSASRAASRPTSARASSSADPERLARLLGDPERPLQVLVAGQGAPGGRGRQGSDPARRRIRARRRARPAASSSSRTTR